MQLILPNQQDTPGVDTRPGPLREWLEALPYTEILCSTQRVTERLQDINDQQHLQPAQRVELMDAFLGAYMRLHDWLSESPQSEAFQDLKNLTRQMAIGYKIAVRDMIESQNRWSRPKYLLSAIEHATRFLALELVCDFHAYQPVDRAIWHDINSLKRIAGNQAGDRQSRESLDFRLANGSTNDIFVQTVLLRLADPYHLPSGSVWAAFGYLGRHVSAAKLTNYGVGDHKPGMFVLRPDSEPSLVTDGVGHMAGSQWLDVREVIRTMQGHVDQLLSGTRPASLGLSDKLTSGDAAQIIARLYTQWLHPVNRRAPRFSSTQAVQVISGLPAIWQALNHGRAFEAEAYEQADSQNTINAPPVNLFLGKPVARQHETALATTRNRGAGGVSLNLPARDAKRLSVGQLVALDNGNTQTNGTPARAIGIIRWLTNENDNSADIGIQYIGRQIETTAVRPLQGGAGQFQPALQIELQHTGQMLETLIAPRGVYRAKRLLELRRGQEQQHIRIDRLIETGATFERFSYITDTPEEF